MKHIGLFLLFLLSCQPAYSNVYSENLLSTAHNTGDVVVRNDLSIEADTIVNEKRVAEQVAHFDVGKLGKMAGLRDWDKGSEFHAGQILAGGKINAEAGNELRNIGSTLAANDDVNIRARKLVEQDVLVDSIMSENSMKFHGVGFKRKQTHRIITRRSNIVSSRGDVQLASTEGDIRNTGSTIAAAGKVNLEAGRDVVLGAKTVSVENKESGAGISGIGYAYSATKANDTKTEVSEIVGGDVSIKAGNDVRAKGALVTARNDLSIEAGRDISFDRERIEKYVKTHGYSAAVRFFGSSAIEAAMNGGNVGDIARSLMREDPLLASLNNLARARGAADRVAGGVLTGVEGFRAMGTFAKAYNSGGLGLKGVAGAEGERVGLMRNGKFDPTLSVRVGASRSEQRYSESKLSRLSAGRNMAMKAGRDVNLIGGTQVDAGKDVSIEAGRNLNVAAAKDTNSNKSSGAGVTVGITASGELLDVGVDANRSKGNGASYTNASIRAGGELATKSGEDTTITGGNLEGDRLRMDVGNKLTLASIQDTYQSKSEGGAISTSGNVSFNQSSADRAWVDQQSSIRGKQGVEINAEKTHLKGAVIDSSAGDVALHSTEVTYENLQDRDNSSGFGASFNTGLGIDPNTGKVQTSPPGAIRGVGDFNYARGRKEGISRATVGKGVIITNSNISNLNRDIAKAQQIVKDKQTHVRVVIPIVDMKQAKRDVAEIKRAVKHIEESFRREQLKDALRGAINEKTPEEIAAYVKQAIKDGKVDPLKRKSFEDALRQSNDERSRALLSVYKDLTEKQLMLDSEAQRVVVNMAQDMAEYTGSRMRLAAAEGSLDIRSDQDQERMARAGQYLVLAQNQDADPDVRAMAYGLGMKLLDGVRWVARKTEIKVLVKIQNNILAKLDEKGAEAARKGDTLSVDMLAAGSAIVLAMAPTGMLDVIPGGKAGKLAKLHIPKPSIGSRKLPSGKTTDMANAARDQLYRDIHVAQVPVFKSSDEAFEFYMKKADEIDVSTGKDRAVFYSGKGNREKAEVFATANGKKTLEMTHGGNWLDKQKLFGPNSPLSEAQATKVWRKLSKRYAEQASGNTVGFVKEARQNGVFNDVEYPALLSNPKVTNVITGGN